MSFERQELLFDLVDFCVQQNFVLLVAFLIVSLFELQWLSEANGLVLREPFHFFGLELLVNVRLNSIKVRLVLRL